MKPNTEKNSHTHAHTHHCDLLLLSTQQKMKAHHFTLISSFLSHSLLFTSLHLESFVSFFFHFSVSPFFGFYISVTLQPYPLRSPSSCLPFTSSLLVCHSLTQLASVGWFQSEAAIFTQWWWLQKNLIQNEFYFSFVCLPVLPAEINASVHHWIEKKDHRPGCWVTGQLMVQLGQ